MLKKTLGILALTMALSGLASAEEVKIGFLVKQAEEPWFQTEWAFAEKAGKDHGFTVIKIAVPDGEKTLSAIDTLAANGAKGFVICPPDVSLGPAIMAKAKLNNLKVLAVDDRFVDAKGKPMEDVPYVGLDAYKIGQNKAKPWPPKPSIVTGTGRTPTPSSIPSTSWKPARSAPTVR